jgi:hypothetical protein
MTDLVHVVLLLLGEAEDVEGVVGELHVLLVVYALHCYFSLDFRIYKIGITAYELGGEVAQWQHTDSITSVSDSNPRTRKLSVLGEMQLSIAHYRRSL